MIYLELAGGFVLLLIGAEVLVRGATSVARRIGVSTLVIGMTVVAFGTSAPELVVTLQAALAGSPDMAVGNIVGSNIANLLLIVGVAGLVMPIARRPMPLVRDATVLVAVTAVFAVLVWFNVVGRIAGALMFAAFLAFLVTSYRRELSGGGDPAAESRRHEAEEIEPLKGGLAVAILAVVGGLAGVILGANLLVSGGVGLARAAGISEAVIGLTLLAIGTSLPELAASVVAAIRGHSDIAIGNVIGSNLFNILAVGGGVAVVTPLPVTAQIRDFDVWVMLAATVVFLPFMAPGYRFGRLLGCVFLGGYAAYLAFLVYGGGGAALAVG